MRKRRLVDMAVLRSGIKKKYAKPAIEAALAVLGDALRAGEDLNIPPLGRVKIQREIDQPKAKVLVTRIRQVKTLAVTPKDPLAEAAE